MHTNLRDSRLTNCKSMDQSLAREKYFILLVKTRGYILEPHVFKAPEKVWNKELQQGTILEEQPINDPRTRTFVVTDQKDVRLDCRRTNTTNKLTQLTNREAKRLLEISSLEERYKQHRTFRSLLERSEEQQQLVQAEVEVSQ